jgi:cellulose synthase/poly-beta-1,6-N-acetylglucosamine synthase-like glycosyltransferase
MTLTYVFEEIFWICILLVFHSYLFYPLLVRLIAKNKLPNQIVFDNSNDFPSISILMAAHNEAAVIESKIKSVFEGNYPIDKIEFLIGSDNSKDATNEIIRNLAVYYPQITLFDFKSRQGKIKIINNLTEKSKNEILILTDSNVIFEVNTIRELVKHFKNCQIGLVDSRMENTGLKRDGISIQEKTYINSEVALKHAEGKLWGAMMGPFGGCFAIRKSVFEPVPRNFLVDDFYINMQVLKKGLKCINEPKAIVFEDVSNDIKEEFRRKIRISAGNFQNLMTFLPMLFKFNGISFSFFSHKVLRWKIPFILIILLTTLSYLSLNNKEYLFILILVSFIILLVFFDLLFKIVNVNIIGLRFLTHFVAMNIALFLGFFTFIKGIKSSVWEPTKRNQ